MSDRLIRKARRGDADAFTALCAPLEGMVYRHCLTMLKNPADAQDAAQDAMLRAFRAMPSFQGQSSVATWLYRIAHNMCLDRLKSPRARLESLPLDAAVGVETGQPENPEAEYLRQSEKEALQKAIATLPDEMQTLLSLRYGDGLAYSELAHVLNLNPGTVKSRLNRVKERLRSLLEGPPDSRTDTG